MGLKTITTEELNKKTEKELLVLIFREQEATYHETNSVSYQLRLIASLMMINQNHEGIKKAGFEGLIPMKHLGVTKEYLQQVGVSLDLGWFQGDQTFGQETAQDDSQSDQKV